MPAVNHVRVFCLPAYFYKLCKIEIDETAILPAVWYVCEGNSPTNRRRLTVFQNTVLTRVIGEEVAAGWRKRSE
jgi:hypothetical protein